MLLYNRRGSKTGKKLAKALGMKAIRDSKWKSSDGVPTVRWGSSKYIPNDHCMLNHSTAIRTAADGFTSLGMLRREHIHVPEIYNSVYDIPENTKVLARDRNHRAGLDIIICETPDQAIEAYLRDNKEIFVRFYETSLELRAHVIDGRVVKSFKKVSDNAKNDQIRTSKRGWSYRRVDPYKHYQKSIPVAVNVANTLGLAFCAIDMAWDVNAGEWLVFEANTAPALNSKTLELYVRELEKLI